MWLNLSELKRMIDARILIVLFSYLLLGTFILDIWGQQLIPSLATSLLFILIFLLTFELGFFHGLVMGSITVAALSFKYGVEFYGNGLACFFVVVAASLVRWRASHSKQALCLENERLKRKLRHHKTKEGELQAKIDREFFNAMAIYEFTSILGSTLQYQEVLNLMVDTILRIVSYDACCLFLIDDNELYIEVARGFSEKAIEETHYRIGDGVAGWVAQTAQPALVLDYERDPRFQYMKYEQHFCSVLSLPLVIKGEVIGVLEILKLEPDAFNRDDLRTLTIVANQAAFAIRNANLYSEVMQLAITDSITGLANHRYFKEVLAKELHRARRYNRQLSLLLMDIDYFKNINDFHGHQAGDCVLAELGKLLRTSIRKVDLAARYGGEEFCIILPETGQKQAMEIAERIRRKVEKKQFCGELELTVSIGVATFPQHALNLDQLIKAADAACYEAKRSGRNSIMLATGSEEKTAN